MTKRELIIAYPGRGYERLKSVFRGKTGVSWMYFGKDDALRREAESALGGDFVYCDIRLPLERAAGEIRLLYTRLVDELNREYGANPEWWFGAVSSRNIHLSDLFQNCCYLEVLKKQLAADPCDLQLILVESLAMARVISSWTGASGIACRIVNGSFLRYSRLDSGLRSLLRWVNFCLKISGRWLASKTSLLGRKNKKNLPKSPVMLVTFIHWDSFDKNGVFKDRYFPYLYDYLRKQKKDIAVFPILSNLHSQFYPVYKMLRKNNPLFLVPEDYLRFSDYLRVITYPLRAIRQVFLPKFFLGFEISELLKEEHFRESATCGLQAVLAYRAFLRLVSLNMTPEKIILWHENHTIDKAIVMAARRIFPGVTVVGAQQFIPYINSTGFFPIISENEAGVLPQLILMMSQYQCQIARRFSPELNCKISASLRYAYIFAGTSRDTQERKRSIFVLLPFSLGEAVEILKVVNDALSFLPDEERIYIKCHPDYTARQLLSRWGKKNWPKELVFFEGGLEDMLPHSAVVVCAGTNSMLEAAVRSIPVIFLAKRTTLNLNPLAGMGFPIVAECYSAGELAGAVRKFLNLTNEEKNEFAASGRKIRDMFFSPPTEENLASFLDDI